MKINTHILYIITIIVLVVLLFRPFAKSDKVDRLEGSTIDTLSFISDTTTFSKLDTLEQDNEKVKIVYREKVVKDTIYIKDTTTNNVYSMEVVQKYFSEPNKYDLWISGVEPLQVDKIKTYNEVVYERVTNTITEAIYPKRTEFYIGGGLFAFKSTFAPMVGISIKTKRNMLISLDYGFCKDGSVYLGSVKFKLGKN